MSDRKIKYGNELPQTKLTDANIKTIFYLWNIEGLNQNEIAKLYGVHKSTISRIVRFLRRSRRTPS